MTNKLTEDKTLKEWKYKLETAKTAYADQRNKMRTYTEYYDGTREVGADPNTNKTPKKLATNVRNIVYELIESQVDSSIPMPKVRPIHPEDDELAKKIERLLENKVVECKFKALNDFMERSTPVQGASFFHVEWDNKAGLHSQLGDLKVSEIHPKRLIPQPGCIEIDDMDYLFLQQLMTRAAVKRTYDVDVSDVDNDDMELSSDREDAEQNPSLVTVNTAYYRNEDGGIGVYIWCGEKVLLDIEDYQARHLDRCAKCGAVMENDVCPECGSKKKKKSAEEYEDLVDSLEVRVDGAGPKMVEPFDTVEEPVMDEEGNPVMDAYGSPQMTVRHEQKKIPYYKPNCYPIIIRRNISAEEKLLGQSDVKAIIDQQDTVKKLGTKINEKLLKGGSYVTLPNGVDVDKSDKELKIVRVKNPQEKALIGVINVQPNVSADADYLETNYAWAKSTLGITDSFQGKYDASARTGTAKQYAINQAAGRLESKRTMKNEAYAELYKVMFKFWLAYADQTTDIIVESPDGTIDHEQINRKEFLKIDKSGEFYWDDEFIFETDPTSTLMANREAMWQSTDMKLQSGAFGPVGDLETAKSYWTLLKSQGYPGASMVLALIEGRLEELQAQQMPPQLPQEGGLNDVF